MLVSWRVLFLSFESFVTVTLDLFCTQDVRKNNSLTGLSFVSRFVFRFFLQFSRDYPYLQRGQFKNCPIPLQKDHVCLMSDLDTTLLCMVTSHID